VSAGLACYTLSADLLNDLKTRGETSLAGSIADDDLGHVLGAAGGSARSEATVKRVEPQPVDGLESRKVKIVAVNPELPDPDDY